ncbi:MAG: FAD-dependent oxidoreductase [Myxococcota bacterium]
MPHRLHAPMPAAHRVWPTQGSPPPWLDISHSRPQSVRDQMVRAQTVVELAFHEKLVGRAPDKQLVVIGAGVAGITAALTAIRRGVRTLLLHDHDEEFACFGLQRSTRRYLDPTVYDWPADHWARPDWGRNAVLGWSAGDADDIVRTQWMPIWRAHRDRARQAGHLRIQGKSRVDDLSFDDRGRLRMPDPAHPGRTCVEPAGLVIECIGPGKERVWGGAAAAPPVDGFRSFDYWDGQDPVADPAFRLGDKTAIVSGGGDGALQEFLWLATGMTGRELAAHLRMDILEDLAHVLENRYQRQYVWLSADNFSERDHAVLARWHADWVSTLERALRDSDLERRVTRRLHQCMPSLPKVRLAHGCDHFHYCFALNRVMTLLVDHFTRHTFGQSLLLPGLAVEAVNGARGHTCGSGPAGCFGRRHEVTLAAPKGTCGSAHRRVEHADIVVIRHGIVSNQFRASRPIPRQMVAFEPLGT